MDPTGALRMAAVAFAAACLGSTLGCGSEPEVSDEVFVQNQCGTCHAVPVASSFPKAAWPTVVRWMSGVLAELGLPEYDEAAIARVSDYYSARAPTELPVLPAEPSNTPVRFLPEFVADDRHLSITNINAVDLNRDDLPDLLVCESPGLGKSGGRLTWFDRPPDTGRWQRTILAELPHPAHTEVLDFNGDGQLDIAVAVLGILEPSERLSGQVVLLLGDGTGQFEARTLLQDVGRVSDVRAGDFNADGRIDFAIAEFGHRIAGSVAWLEQGPDGEFSLHRIFEKAGTIHVSVTDLNGDGTLDIVALVSQETEAVIALLNDGSGNFEPRTLFDAGGPEFGASGMELVDLDGDLDLDILVTNGDSADTGAKTGTKFRPYHGVHWLENRGALQFVRHDIGRLYGAYSVTAGDLDGDGDLDVVAGSFFTDLRNPRRYSLIWFENDGQQAFRRRSIARLPRSLVTLELVDLDANGRLDLVAGGLMMPAYAKTQGRFPFTALLSVWRNQ